MIGAAATVDIPLDTSFGWQAHSTRLFASLFELFLRERKYLRNVSHRTIEWRETASWFQEAGRPKRGTVDFGIASSVDLEAGSLGAFAE